MAANAAEGVLVEEVTRLFLADLEHELAARDWQRTVGSEVAVRTVVGGPVGRREVVLLDKGRREADHRITVVVTRRRRTVAGCDEEVARGVDGGSAYGPHPALTTWRLVPDEAARAVEVRPDDPAVIVTAVSVQAAVVHVDPAVGHHEGGPLLLHGRIHARRVERPGEPDRPGRGIDGHQDVRRVGSLNDLGDRVHEARSRIFGRRAGDAQRVDVTARQVAQRYGRAHVGAPHHLAGPRVEPVERVILGGDHDSARHEERLSVDVAVEVW